MAFSLKPNGFKGKLLVHVMPWFGDGVHRDVGYQSWNPWTIRTQLQAMKSLGIEGIIVTYTGIAKTTAHRATQEMCFQCESANMLFGIMLNGSITPDQVVPTLQNPEFKQMLASPMYLPEKYVLEFGLVGPNVPASIITGNLPGNYSLLSKHTGFTWLEKASSDGSLNAHDNTIKTLTRDYAVNKTIAIPCVARTFNDGNLKDLNKSVWDITKPVTLIDSKAGGFWWELYDLIPNVPFPYLSIITWNDYEEGAQIEDFASILSEV